MITENLYNTVLLNPLRSDLGQNNELYVVSGYASATFLQRHFSEARKLNPQFKLHLIIGMRQKRRDHAAYMQMISKNPDSLFGYYYSGNPEVHAKSYCWSRDGILTEGFSGSANYSQYGFFAERQLNQMTPDDPFEIKGFFNRLLCNSLPITEYLPAQEELVLVPSTSNSIAPGEIHWVENDRSVRISLLSRDGSLAQGSGLNWGLRKNEQRREPNQAYLAIRKTARKEGFLPEKKFTFTLLTDDKTTLDCTVQQDGRKAISTTDNNSILGKYFRARLAVPDGERVTKEHLINYGRTDFLLTKLDQETFHMDFSQPTATCDIVDAK